MFLEKDTLTTEDLIDRNYIVNSSTCMYRTSVIRRLPEEIYNRFFGDWVINMACGRMGKIGFMRDWMSVYRQHSGGVYSGVTPVDNWRLLITAIDSYNQLFGYDYDRQFRQKKEELEGRIASHEKKRQVQNQQVSVVKPKGSLLMRAIRNPKKASSKLLSLMNLYGFLLVRAIRHPKRAFNRLRTILHAEASRWENNRPRP